MMPAAMNSDALNTAWLMMWKIAATVLSWVSSPNSSVISPRWLMVEYASKPLRSRCSSAIAAPKISVASPVMLTR
ncbi:hypothetical protein D9M72_578530 [compost metagenome]